MYRNATKRDLEDLVRLNYEAFKEYPLFRVLRDDCKSEQEYEKLVYALMNIYIKSNFGRATYIVRVLHGKIVACAVLLPPGRQRATILKDMLYGGLRVMSILGVKKTLAFNSFLDTTTEEFEDMGEEHWHLDQFAVLPSVQGQSVGSKMMQQAVLPFLRRKGVEHLTLITNKEINRRFYDKNGFRQVFNNEVMWNGQVVNNWGFRIDL